MSDYERLITENNPDIDLDSKSEISVNGSGSEKLSHLNFRLDVIGRLIERHGTVNEEEKDDQEFCPVSYD
ncbi:hypothetical protein TNCV_156101 [Trichonephila clavipes]|nr:hypothetical protein TNCV_156101 [Trichonephila clavipes]